MATAKKERARAAAAADVRNVLFLLIFHPGPLSPLVHFASETFPFLKISPPQVGARRMIFLFCTLMSKKLP